MDGTQGAYLLCARCAKDRVSNVLTKKRSTRHNGGGGGDNDDGGSAVEIIIRMGRGGAKGLYSYMHVDNTLWDSCLGGDADG